MRVQVTGVEPFVGELVYVLENGEAAEYERYSAEGWTWRIGESTETVYACSELERAYQLHRELQVGG